MSSIVTVHSGPVAPRGEANHDRARLLALAVEDVQWDWNLVTSQIWWSAGLRTRLGYESAADTHDAPWWRECIHPDDRARVGQALTALLASAGDTWQEQYRFQRRDGTFANVLDHGLVVRRDRVAVRMVGVMLDMPQRGRSEQTLRDIEERHRQILDAITDCVLVKGPRSRIVWGNKAFRELYGMTNEQLKGLIDAPFSEPDHTQRYIRDDERVFSTGVPLDIPDEPVSGHDGVVRHMHSVKSPIFDSTGQVIMTVGVFRDITERKRMQEQLLLVDRMASLGTLAAGVAHEINNPLAFVLSNLDLLTEELSRLGSVGLGPSTAQLLEFANDARDGAERVRKIVGGLKAFSRADQERRVPLQVAHVIDLAINMASTEIRHRARIVKDFGPVPLVEADETRLAQVFINLLVNAAHALSEGNADTNEIRITTSTDAAGRAVIDVSDTGVGMTPEVARRVFDPFFTTKPVGEGTGLGLSICHGVVAALGGEITVESQVGQGTTFRVVLLPSQGALPAEVAVVSTVPARADGRRGRILIVDDDPMVGTVLSRALSRDHDVEVLNDGRAALERIRAGARYDVVFCDLMMPVVTGMAFYAELKTIAPELVDRIVLMTGGAFTPAAREFLDSVSNDRMDKPFDVDNVRRLVRRLV